MIDSAAVSPMVSVFMMTYNHAPYIRQAIDSVLSQKTTFSVEIVIGEDCSTDGTRAIVAEYSQQYPNRVKALLHKVNVGASRNQQLVLEACTGKYVAILEGDDYWIDNSKLQKQVDFLEKNNEYSIVFSRTYELVDDIKLLSPINPWELDKIFSIEDLASGNFIHTPSVLFRNGLIDTYPDWFASSPIGDYVIHLFNAKKGLVKYMSETMAVYRKFTGTWSSKSRLYQIEKFINVLDNLISEKFNEEVIKSLKSQKQYLLNEYCVSLLNENNFSFLDKIKNQLLEENTFENQWILSIYPKRIQAILNSRTYKIASFFSKIKNKLKFS